MFLKLGEFLDVNDSVGVKNALNASCVENTLSTSCIENTSNASNIVYTSSAHWICQCIAYTPNTGIDDAVEHGLWRVCQLVKWIESEGLRSPSVHEPCKSLDHDMFQGLRCGFGCLFIFLVYFSLFWGSQQPCVFSHPYYQHLTANMPRVTKKTRRGKRKLKTAERLTEKWVDSGGLDHVLMRIHSSTHTLTAQKKCPVFFLHIT